MIIKTVAEVSFMPIVYCLFLTLYHSSQPSGVGNDLIGLFLEVRQLKYREIN